MNTYKIPEVSGVIKTLRDCKVGDVVRIVDISQHDAYYKYWIDRKRGRTIHDRLHSGRFRVTGGATITQMQGDAMGDHYTFLYSDPPIVEIIEAYE